MKTLLSFALIAVFLALSPGLEAQVIQGSSTVKKIKIGKPVVVSSRSVKAIPDLVIKNEVFNDVSGNNVIDGGESAYINFKIQNIGTGGAKNVIVNVSLKNNQIKGLTFTKKIEVGNIPPNAVKDVSIPLRGGMDLVESAAEFKIEVIEAEEYDAYPLEMRIATQPFQAPNLVLADAQFSTTNGGKIIKQETIILKVLLQNIGKGNARDITLIFNFPNPSCKYIDTTRYSFISMKPGETKELDFPFLVTRKYSESSIPVQIKLTESYGKYSRDTTVSVKLDQDLLARNSVSVTPVFTPTVTIEKQSLSSDVDKNIPEISEKNDNKYALIIGNEEYAQKQSGLSTEINVEYARSDAAVFRDYVVKTLGFPEDQVVLLTDATTGMMNQKLEWISKLCSKAGKDGELLFYYAGHGLPDEVTHIPYLIPVDVNGTNVTLGIKLSDVYKKFSETGAKKISIFLDACFTGGGRESGLLAARSVKVKPTEEILAGNFVVFAATTKDQSALPYTKQKHGMFTYFLLKKLQESKGNLTYQEFTDYVIKNVSKESLVVNQKEQDPTVNVSPEVVSSWQTWKLK